jgi:hypothetical protein
VRSFSGAFYMFVLILASTMACKHLPFWKEDEGLLVYEISYPYDQEHPLIGIFPSELKMYFSGHMVRYELESFMGIVSSVVVADSRKETFQHSFSLFGDAVLMEVGKGELDDFLAELDPISTVLQPEKDSLVGCECQRGLIRYITSAKPAVPFCFTEDIRIPAPNFFTPFHRLDAVLLDYEMEQMGLIVRLRAKSLARMEVDPKIFDIHGKEKMTPVDFAGMKAKIEELLQTGKKSNEPG